MTGGLIAHGTANVFGMEMEGRLFMCSSTLIAPDVVLLASHCIDLEAMATEYGVELQDLELRWSRKTDLSMYGLGVISEWPSDSVKAWDWVAHPDWDFATLQMGLAENNDIALLFLEEPVLDVPFAYLPTAEEGQQIEVEVEVAVVGWGQQTATSQTEQPPAGTVGIKQMGMSRITRASDYEFQVGVLETDVRKCHGDSGGPSFMWVDSDSEETMRVVGVTSHSYDETDCFQTGGVDTRVDYYLDWIDSEMRARCEDETRAWCDVHGIIPVDWEVGDESPDGDGDDDDDDDINPETPEASGTCAVQPYGGLVALPLLFLAAIGARRRSG
jgi:hypothetical protein